MSSWPPSWRTAAPLPSADLAPRNSRFCKVTWPPRMVHKALSGPALPSPLISTGLPPATPRKTRRRFSMSSPPRYSPGSRSMVSPSLALSSACSTVNAEPSGPASQTVATGAGALAAKLGSGGRSGFETSAAAVPPKATQQARNAHSRPMDGPSRFKPLPPVMNLVPTSKQTRVSTQARSQLHPTHPGLPCTAPWARGVVPPDP